MKYHFKILFRVLLLLGLAVSLSCGSETSGKSSSDSTPKRKVKVVKALKSRLPGTISVSGTLAAEEEVALSFKVQGRIRQIFVDLGSPVKRGQALVELEPADFDLRVKQAGAAYQQARVRLGLTPDGQDDASTVDPEQTGVVRQAKAQLQETQLTRDRRKALHEEGLISQSEFDDAEAAYQVASGRYQDALEEVRNRQAILIQRRAELDLARQQLLDSVLRAPLDGSISRREVSPGEFVAVGAHALTLVRLHPLRLKLELPERETRDVRAGQKVEVRVEGDNNIYTGSVARLSPAITADNRTLMVESEVPNQKGALRPGSFARAEIITQPDRSSILVPASSVITFAGIEKVISLNNGQTVEKQIKTGRKIRDQIEVTEGISAGDPIVVQPGNLVGGETVQAVW
jgi:RND family efflux transporter MFP subunit